ncbi:MAG: transcriptional regulator [Candidatus Aenigmatarchaeota archaeon]
MIKAPCELAVWELLPSLRRELVKAMVKRKIKRKEIAKSFGITEAAISQYLKSKRGANLKFNKRFRDEIEKSAIKIANTKRADIVIFEICRLCCILNECKNANKRLT